MSSFCFVPYLRARLMRSGLTAALLGLLGCQPPQPPKEPQQASDRQLVLEGRAFPERYNELPGRAQGHHLIVWREGRQAHKALIESDVPDKDVLDALLRMGATAGDNLSERTWTANEDPSAPEPDQHVEGSPVHIAVRWSGETHALFELLESTREEDLDIRVGGHADLIQEFRSGCITCAFSCPGGRTSNATYTIRDQVEGRHEFRADLSKWPPDGTPIEVVITLE
ncbi:MAG: YdjY domain-containing protein [Planctomycetota bacterium]